MNKKIIALLSLLLLLANVSSTFGMQKPLDEQQLNGVVQNFKAAIEAAKSDDLWSNVTRNAVITAFGLVLMTFSRRAIKEILCLQTRSKISLPEVYITLGTLFSLGIALAIKGGYEIYNSNTRYRVTYRQAAVYPRFILEQLINHPALQDDITQQALKDALTTKAAIYART